MAYYFNGEGVKFRHDQVVLKWMIASVDVYFMQLGVGSRSDY